MPDEAPELPLSDEVTRRLDLITQIPGAVLKYDANGDGVLDAAEWEMLRNIVESEVVRERAGLDEESSDVWTPEEELHDPRVDLPVLEVLDTRYEVLREIGRGAQGKTLLARRREDSHYVAVKELTFATLDNWKSLELFEREADVLRGLAHDRIPSFVDSFSVDVDGEPARFFLVQSYVSGSSLDVLLANRERVSEGQVIEFAQGVLEVLHYLHTLVPPVIHRDVKPSNLIKQPDGSYALVDFGGAQVVVASDVGGSTIIGTTGYMPPEQLTGRAGPPSDLYALGATMIHLVTHISPANLPTKRLKLDWKDRASLQPRLAAFIDRLIEPIVEDRFDSARAAMKDLASLQTSTTALARQDADVRTIEAVTQRRSNFLATHNVPKELLARKSSVGGMTVYDLRSHRLRPLLQVGGMMVVLSPLVLLIAGKASVVVLLIGIALAAASRLVEHEALGVAPDGRFEIRRGAEQKTVRTGNLRAIDYVDDHLVLNPGADEQRVGTTVGPVVRRWLHEELRQFVEGEPDSVDD